MDIGPCNAARVVREDDRSVHLGQLGEPLRAELGVEQETPRAYGENFRTVADDDQSPHVCLEDAVQTFAQRPAWSYRSQRLDHRRAQPLRHRLMLTHQELRALNAIAKASINVAAGSWRSDALGTALACCWPTRLCGAAGTRAS